MRKQGARKDIGGGREGEGERESVWIIVCGGGGRERESVYVCVYV